MTRRELLSRAQTLLAHQNVPYYRLEAELLLRFVLKINTVELFASPDAVVTPARAKCYFQLIDRRLRGEPSFYIIGKREFYGRDFKVTPAVLIPRPETELLVEKVIAAVQKCPRPLIADIGTGSGIIGITLALELPPAAIIATDISGEALKVARQNSRQYGVEKRITFLQGNLLAPLPWAVNVIAANLPYVTTADVPRVNTIGFEPEIALDGGADGLDLVRELILTARSKLLPGGCLLLEIGLGQQAPLKRFLSQQGLSEKTVFDTDLSGISRVVTIRYDSS